MLYDNYKHSASAGNLWFENQSAFLWRYGYRNWGKDKPRAMMGKAVERAVYDALTLGVEDPSVTASFAVTQFDRMNDGEVHEEREAVGPIASGMFAKLKTLGGTFVRKPKEARLLPGLGKRINFECDLFHSERGIIDLKATLRIAWAADKEPAPSWGHVRQQGLYRHLENGTPVSLLYATPKRVEFYEIPVADAERGAREMFDAFEQIERWADKFPTPEQAMRFIPLNTESFYWDDDADVQSARKLWSTNNTLDA